MKNKKKINHEWVRVTGPDLDQNKKARTEGNKKIFESKFFKDLCEFVGIDTTKRQAGKYRNGKGLAYMSKTAFKTKQESEQSA